MQSPIVKNGAYIENKADYSELKVMRSAAGYYVGTTCTTDGFEEPGSRDSGYFPTKEQAQKYLDMVNEVENPQEYLRGSPDEPTC
jgi:hypothetical protein